MGWLCMPACPSEYCPGHCAPMYCIAHAVQSVSASTFPSDCFVMGKEASHYLCRVYVSSCMTVQS